MADTELTVRNPSGLHARPAALFAETAGRFVSRITVENLDRESKAVNAKSILLVLTIGATSGSRLRLVADGPDAGEAIRTLRELVESGLGETVDSAG